MRNTLKPHLIWSNFKFSVLFCRHGKEYGPCNRHRHDDFYELVFIRSGNSFHVMGDRRLKISTGNVFLIPPGEIHSYEDANDLEIYNILFAPSFLKHFHNDMQSLPNYQLLFNVARQPGQDGNILKLDNSFFPEIIQMLDEIIREQNQMLPGAKTAILADFLKVLLHLCRHCDPLSGEMRISNAYRISRLLAELNMRFKDPWTLSEMARFTNLSESSLRQQFKLLTGISPVRYLVNTRLAKAFSHLHGSELTISEIAGKCGFPDSNYFSRQFRKQYGFPPRSVRR
ncbi:MAG: HTH-type transcriptional activator RhaR [Lentisphaerae bacterium ADurb.Bin242]|nr:MAG: HTH-type transcriptional activator RhaR [Lentisphaerae bacterium ADurb.Bin242]